MRIAAPLVVAALAIPTAPQTVEPGFTSLFNGRDLTGWKIAGPTESFRVEDGAIVANGVYYKNIRIKSLD